MEDEMEKIEDLEVIYSSYIIIDLSWKYRSIS